MVARQALQVLLGGSWHDFSSFAELLQGWLACAPWEPSVSFEPSCLLRLGAEPTAVVLINTCYDDHTHLKFDLAHLNALTAWVRGGGGLLALHATAVAAAREARLAALIGGRFVRHPKKQPFLVEPAPSPHPITNGIAAFEIEDEPYELELSADVNVHLKAILGERQWPSAWSREEGTGRVVYLSLGHDEAAWAQESYRSIILSALSWLARS